MKVNLVIELYLEKQGRPDQEIIEKVNQYLQENEGSLKFKLMDIVDNIIETIQSPNYGFDKAKIELAEAKLLSFIQKIKKPSDLITYRKEISKIFDD